MIVKKKRGVILKKDTYHPYHGWRHGYRRERCWNCFIFGLKIILVVEIAVLSGRYLKEHTLEMVYEREIIGNASGEDVFGVGVDVEKGEMFWFHREVEVE